MSEVRVAVLVGVAVTEGGLEGASGAYLVILSVLLMTGPHCENSHSCTIITWTLFFCMSHFRKKG